MEFDIEDIMEAAKLKYIRSYTVGASRKVHRYVSIHGGQWGEIAEYLTWNIPKKYRVVLTRFRMGAHALEVETVYRVGIMVFRITIGFVSIARVLVWNA